MNDPTTGSNPAAVRALDIAEDLAGPNGHASIYLADFRVCLQDLIGHPLSRDASRALNAAIYHLDGVEAACRQLVLEIRTDHS
jgi:hypothetical protein